MIVLVIILLGLVGFSSLFKHKETVEPCDLHKWEWRNGLLTCTKCNWCPGSKD